METEKESIVLHLSVEEYRYILEALLFACSVDISAKWYEEDVEKFKTLAFRLRTKFPKIPTENTNVVINEKENFELYDAHTDDILEYFPEILEKIS